MSAPLEQGVAGNGGPRPSALEWWAERRELLIAGIVIVIGTGSLIVAANLAYTVNKRPGPGFMPLWASIVLIIAGIVLLVTAIRARRASTPARKSAELLAEAEAVADEPEFIPGLGWRPWATLGLVLFAALALAPLGFILTAAVFSFVFLFLIARVKLVRSLIVSIVLPLVLQILFDRILDVPLPLGVFG